MLKVLLLLLMEVVDSQVGLASVPVVDAAVRGRGGAAGRAERVGARSDVVLGQARVHRAVAPRRLHVLVEKRVKNKIRVNTLSHSFYIIRFTFFVTHYFFESTMK